MGRAGLRRGAELVAAALFATMFGAFIIQIVSRYVFNHPVQWSLEVCSLAYIWIVFWSAALLLGERQHITFDLLYKAAPPRVRRIIALFITLSIGLVFFAGLPGSLDFVTFLRRSTLILHVPLSLAYSCFLIFMIAVVAGAAIRTWRLFGKNWRHDL
jgi:TRAP-type C4-dicarboxylate transport system permease small subunit